MPDNEARVTVKIDAPPLGQAMGWAGQTEQQRQNALQYAEMIAQRRAAGRVGQADVAIPAMTGNLMTPDRIDRILQHLARWKLSEQQINELIAQRRKDLEAISQNLLKTPDQLRMFQTYVRQGVKPMDALQALADPKDFAEGQRRATHYARQINQMQMYREDLAEGLYRSQDRALGKWIPHLGGMFTNALRLIGIAGAVSVMNEARRASIEYGITVADIGGFVGSRYGRDLSAVGLRAAGPYGLYAIDAARIGGALEAAGMRGDVEQQAGMVQRFAGLSMALGFGREGLAQQAQGAVGRGTFADLDRFRNFTETALVAGVQAGLNPSQRQFLFEQGKSTYEAMSRALGGKPLDEDAFFIGINTLMRSMTGLGLPAGGAPIAMEVMGRFGQGMSPIGKGFGDVIRLGAMLGINAGGDYLETLRQINAMVRDPNGFPTVLQRLGNIAPGQRPNRGQMNNLMATVSAMAPQLLDPIGRLAVAGVDIPDLIARGPGSLPANQQEVLKQTLKDAQEMSEDRWRRTDIDNVKAMIEGIGGILKMLEADAKKLLGPEGQIAVGAGTSLLPTLWNLVTGFVGGRLAGGAAGSVLSRVGPAAAAALPWLGRLSLSATAGYLGYQAGSLINEYLPNMGAAAYRKMHGVRLPPPEIMETIIAAAQAHGIDPLVALGLANVESSFDPTVANKQGSGARGLFQLMPDTARRRGVRNVYDPVENANAAMQELRERLDRFGGDMPKALAGFGGFVSKDPSEYIEKIVASMLGVVAALENNSAATEGNTKSVLHDAARSIARTRAQGEKPRRPEY